MTEFVNACGEQKDLGGGHFQHTAHIKPIAYERNGVLRRVTNVLTATSAEKMSIGVDELAQFRVCPRIAKDEPLIHFGSKASFVQLTPIGANEVAGDVRDNVITFRGAWTGADLVYTNGGHILREDIILGKDHPTRFQFLISESAGLDREKLETPGFRIVDPVLTKNSGEDGIPLKWEKSDDHGRVLLTCELPKGDWAGWTIDPTLTLQPGITAGLDTYITKTLPTDNNGIHMLLISGGNVGPNEPLRVLLQFSLTSLPPRAIVSSAIITLYCESEASTIDYVIGMHRGLTQWYEGTVANAPPPPGVDGSVWDFRNYNGLVPWGLAGGLAGTDYTISATDTVIVIGPGASYSWTITSLVQGWVAGTMINYGVWLINQSEIVADSRKRFPSSDHGTAILRPKLVVNYTLPAGGMFNPPIAAPFRGAFG